ASNSPHPPEAKWKQSRYGFAAFLFLSLLVAQSALRLGLFLAFRPRTAALFGDGGLAFLIGLKADTWVALLLTTPFLFWCLVLPERQFAAAWHRRLVFAGLFVF